MGGLYAGPVRSIDASAHPVIRVVLLIFGLGLGANALWLAAVANLTLGTLLVGLLAVAFLVWAGVFGRLTGLANGLIVAALVALLAWSGFLAWFGNHNTVDGHEDAVIVLGAAVHGSTLSNTFKERLDTTVAYHAQNPDAWIVVTGGQGPQEDLTEADAAATYLESQGIPGDQILRDEKSTSTEENFRFAKDLLDRQLGATYRVGFITDDFHVFRAERLARAAGLDPTHLSCHSPWYFWPVNYARESVVALWNLLAGS